MHPTSPPRLALGPLLLHPLVLLVMLLVGALLGGCGDEPKAPGDDTAPKNGSAPRDDTAPSEEWSAPESIAATGSPDGEAQVRSPESLLADLRSRVADGRGHADPSFQKAVQDVASVLWEERVPGAEVHMQVLAIAGEVSHWLAGSPGARAERAKSNPTDLAIYDAFLRASAEGPEAYQRWCEGDAAKLMAAHREAAYKRHFPDRVPARRVDGAGR